MTARRSLRPAAPCWWLGAASLLALAACSSLQPAAPSAQSINGRLSVRVDSEPPRSVTATFELRGTPRAGELDLSTPLGSLMARARWSPDEVVLATPKQEKRYADLDALTQAVLGESLPVPALFDWLNGRPWPGAPSATLAGAPGFEQLGWTVSLAHFGDQGAIEAHRAKEPPVTVRARVER
jgi:outer membrane lipoprotein LolB